MSKRANASNEISVNNISQTTKAKQKSKAPRAVDKTKTKQSSLVLRVRFQFQNRTKINNRTHHHRHRHHQPPPQPHHVNNTNRTETRQCFHVVFIVATSTETQKSVKSETHTKELRRFIIDTKRCQVAARIGNE